jgi:CDGSH-type Zn-finger protein
MDVEPATIVIEPTENGPLLVRNLEALLSADGSPLETKEVTALCRCGGSQKSRFATDAPHERLLVGSAR